MALSINQILAATKIEGLELVKVTTEGGNYFVASYKGCEQSIMVNAIGHMDRRQWVETLLTFVTAVMQSQIQPVATEAPAEEPAPTEDKPYAVKLVKHVDGSVSAFVRRKLVETFQAPGKALDAFLAFHFGDHPHHIRVKEARVSKRQPKK